MKRKWIFLAPLAILALFAFVALGGVIVQQLWNWLLPPLFGWRLITFWQGLGILALCRILFGGFGRHGSHRSGFRSRKGGWEAMTAEERQRFRQGIRERCGFGPSTSESQG
ncbi:MAG: hypothetical protein ABSC93_02635 [Bryobacteraceae bacterium]|jgi:hypothetical protein